MDVLAESIYLPATRYARIAGSLEGVVVALLGVLSLYEVHAELPFYAVIVLPILYAIRFLLFGGVRIHASDGVISEYGILRSRRVSLSDISGCEVAKGGLILGEWGGGGSVIFLLLRKGDFTGLPRRMALYGQAGYRDSSPELSRRCELINELVDRKGD